MRHQHVEPHNLERAGWLRAAVLGANDGILSTASLVLGVAAAQATTGDILTAGVAGMVAGAMSMAAGEYVSVHSQADMEQADIEREQHELATDGDREKRELMMIYVNRGLDRDLAAQVADQLTAHDALAAHTRDELGITDELRARPLQAAMSSAASFGAGALLPLLVAVVSSRALIMPLVAGASLAALALLGAVSSKVAGASAMKGALRVTFWGAFAMALTGIIGAIFGVSMG